MAKEPFGLERHIALRPHDVRWAGLFEAERSRLNAVLGDDADVQHVGSTAIPGLSAKPILDIAIGIESFNANFAFVRPLAALGYTFRGEHGISRRHYFVRETMGEMTRTRTHHLHMVGRTYPQWLELRSFRDYLRAHPEAVTAYQALKLELARQFPRNREAYTDGKYAFVQSILSRAE